MPYPQSPWEAAADVPLAFSLWYLSRASFESELAEAWLLPDEPETLFVEVHKMNLPADINEGQVEVSLALRWDDCQGCELDVLAVAGGNEAAVAKIHEHFDNLNLLDLYNFDEETA